jgi:hypothetical protein
MIRSQYYKISITDKDVTQDVIGNISLEELDSVYTALTFSLKNGYVWLGSLGIGNVVLFEGGNTEDGVLKKFRGYIQQLKPKFNSDGRVSVGVTCLPLLKPKGTEKPKNVVYPMKNHYREWARKKSLRYSEIVENLAKDIGYNNVVMSVGNKKDRTATYISAVAQSQRTDWSFMNYLAKKIDCVIWEEQTADGVVFYCKDESEIVEKIADITFFFPSIKGGKYSIEKVNPDKQIRLKTVAINLDSRKAKANKKITTKTDPKTGKSVLGVDELDPKTGKWTTYFLDEDSLRREPQEKRDEIQKLIEDNKFKLDDWTVLKKYFKDAATEHNSSREPEQDIVQFSDKKGNKVKKEHKKSYSLNAEALRKESPEKKAELLGKSARGELSDEDFKKYFKEVDKGSVEEAGNNKAKKPSVTGSNKKKKRRDAGFNIKVTCNGDSRITAKKSYVLEGLSKYSNKYYLYRIINTWGNRGYEMNLTFTK